MDYFNEGNKLYNDENYKKALDYYKKSISKKEKEACSYYNAGVCYIKLKDFCNAIDMLKHAIKIQRESKYFFNLGYCYAMLEDNTNAIINFNLAWATNNDDKDCERALDLLIKKINN